MEMSEAIERLNKDRKDIKAREALRDKLKGYTALCVREGKILYTETLEALDHCEETGQPAPDAITLADWEAEAQEREACPITGRALMGGRVRIDRPHGLSSVSVDWGPIGGELRLLAAYRAETDGLSDPIAAVEDLSASTLPSEWVRARRDWDDLLKIKTPTTPQRDLIARVKARVIFSKARESVIKMPSVHPSVYEKVRPFRVVVLHTERQGVLFSDLKRLCKEEFGGDVLVDSSQRNNSSSMYIREERYRNADAILVIASPDIWNLAETAALCGGKPCILGYGRQVLVVAGDLSPVANEFLNCGVIPGDWTTINGMASIVRSINGLLWKARPLPKIDGPCAADRGRIGCPGVRGPCVSSGEYGMCGRLIG